MTRPVRRLFERHLPGFEIALAPEDALALPRFVRSRFPGAQFVIGMGNIAGPPWRLLQYLERQGRRLDR